MRARFPLQGPLVRRVFLAVIVVVVFAAPFLGGGLNLLSLLTQAAIYAALAVSLDLVWGYGGILDLGHAAWFGIGALGVGIMTTELSPTAVVISVDRSLGPHIVGLLLGLAIAAVLAAVVGWFAFSSKGQSAFYIATITLALSIVAGTIYIQIPQFTGGEAGLFGFALGGFDPTTAYWAAVICLVIVTAVVWLVMRSDFGVLVRAARDQDQRVRYLGFNVPAVKIMVFVGGAVLAAFAGGVYGWTIGLVSPPMFDFIMATNILIWVAIGGRASIFGPIVGAAVITVGSAQLNTSIPAVWQLIVGVLLIVVITFLPRGLVAPIVQSWRRIIGGGRNSTVDRSLAVSVEVDRADEPGAKLMSLCDFSFGYGQRKVLSGVSLDFYSGELLAIIGPNGAGKSTLLTAVTDGRLRHDGKASFQPSGLKIDRRPPHALARMGLARKFQTPVLFPTLTVAETILLAGYRGKLPSPLRRTRVVPVTKSVLEIVEATGLDAHLNDRGDELAHGLKQGLELAATVMTCPRILMLDEPTAGLTTVEREVIGRILTSLVAESGLSVVLIEHDLDFVKKIADRVAVLARGTVISTGSPEEVADSHEVREVYSGEAGVNGA